MFRLGKSSISSLKPLQWRGGNSQNLFIHKTNTNAALPRIINRLTDSRANLPFVQANNNLNVNDNSNNVYTKSLLGLSFSPLLMNTPSPRVDPSLIADHNHLITDIATHTLSNADRYFPVRWIQDGLVFVHDTTGLPWWASLVTLVLAIRVSLAPLMLLQYKNTIRSSNVQPLVSELNTAFQRKQAAGTITKMDVIEHRKALKEVMVQHGANPLYTLLPTLAIAPIFMSFFFALRGFESFAPSWQTGGALWFNNLAKLDPLCIEIAQYISFVPEGILLPMGLPVIAALLQFASFKLGTDGAQGSNSLPKPIRRFFYVISLGSPFVTCYFPTGLILYFGTSSLFGLIQTQIWRSSFAKKLFNIPERQQIKKSTATDPSTEGSTETEKSSVGLGKPKYKKPVVVRDPKSKENEK